MEDAAQAGQARQLDAGLEQIRAGLAGSALLNQKSWALLSLLLSAQHRDQAALEAVDAGLKMLDQSALLHRIRCRLLLAQGDEQGALQACTEQLARLPPTDTRASLDLAEVFAQLGEDAEAQACLNKLRDADGWTPEALTAQAVLQTVRGDIEAATSSAQTAQALHALHAPASHQLGWLAAARDELSTAKVHFSDAVQEDPWHAKAWFSLGVVCKQQGQLDDARDCLNVALALQQTQPVLPFSVLDT